MRIFSKLSTAISLMLLNLLSINNIYAETAPAIEGTLPKISCVGTDKLDEKGLPVGSVNTFSMSMINSGTAYLICTSDEVMQGQVIKAEFSDDSTKPNNSSNNLPTPPRPNGSFNKTVTVDTNASTETPWVGNLSPTPTESSKPVPGNYRATIFINNVEVETIPFSIQ